MTFYFDIILLENMMMNYIILFATGFILKLKIKQIRLLLSCLIGSLYAVVSYISEIPIYNYQITKFLLSITMIYIAFYPITVKGLLKELLVFYLTSFCFGGVSYFLLYAISPSQVHNINGILTGSYPIKMAILGGTLGFFIITISFHIVKRKLDKNSIFYNVKIVYQEKECYVKIMLDTGNLLKDPITSLPVMIVEKESLETIIHKKTLENLLHIAELENEEAIEEELRKRCRLLPFSSVGKQNGMLIGFKPDYVVLYEDEKETRIKEVIIGIYQEKLSKNGWYSGLMGLELLNFEDRKTGEKHEYYSDVKD